MHICLQLASYFRPLEEGSKQYGRKIFISRSTLPHHDDGPLERPLEAAAGILFD
jgi:hypothetical protein